ncbi:MAG: methyltransferase domain-containing protein [Planctomycetes bacterium]|nr:methyltransferase domain-containing protein [Planctomycetota bacterium]
MKKWEKICRVSIKLAMAQSNLVNLVERLRRIEPDISMQELSETPYFNGYIELKRRSLQAFQCSLMLKIINDFASRDLTVVDIGDSAGTHMLYLRELTKDKFNLDTISVNLDPRAIEKIKARGLKAMLCRAEELDLGEQRVDLFASFEMVEHLHNPAIFFRRLAKKTPCNKLLITVPYLRQSRVGLHHVRHNIAKKITAEEEHIFELSPEDWTLLIKHSGWKVIYSKIYYQYPRNFPFISQLFAKYWRRFDYEGFWGAILEKDTTFTDNYQDWEE